MPKQSKLALLCALLLCGFAICINGENVCGLCMDTNVLCLNETHFQYCSNGDAVPSIVLMCADGKVCTTSATSPCILEESIVDETICTDSQDTTTECGCTGQTTLTCISDTEFGLCSGTELISTGSCEEGSLCSTDYYASHSSFCAPQCVLDHFGYSVNCEGYTEAPTTQPSETELTTQCYSELSSHATSNYYYIQNSLDETCTTYIYCQLLDNVMYAVYYTCSSGYFNDGSCQSTKPEGCV